MNEWFDSYPAVTRLGRWLLDEQGYTAEQLQDYYERPYRYGDEWQQLIEATADDPQWWLRTAQSANNKNVLADSRMTLDDVSALTRTLGDLQ